MADVKVEGSLGKTRYSIVDSSPGMVQITRINSDGETQMFFLRALIIDYALEALTPKVRALIRAALLG